MEHFHDLPFTTFGIVFKTMVHSPSFPILHISCVWYLLIIPLYSHLAYSIDNECFLFFCLSYQEEQAIHQSLTVKLILIIQSGYCQISSPHNHQREVFLFFSLQLMVLGKHFKAMQISCCSLKYLPRVSIHWWFLCSPIISMIVAECWFSSSSL